MVHAYTFRLFIPTVTNTHKGGGGAMKLYRAVYIYWSQLNAGNCFNFQHFV